MPEAPETPPDDAALPVVRGEVLDAELVRRTPLPAPVLAAAGGFVAGVATYVAVRVLRAVASPRRLLGRRRRRRVERGVDIAATRSFLVDVHFLKR